MVSTSTAPSGNRSPGYSPVFAPCSRYRVNALCARGAARTSPSTKRSPPPRFACCVHLPAGGRDPSIATCGHQNWEPSGLTASQRDIPLGTLAADPVTVTGATTEAPFAGSSIDALSAPHDVITRTASAAYWLLTLIS